MTIWKRYFLTELVKVFFLILFAFYFLYVLIDYSLHAKALQHESIRLYMICLYYTYQFLKRADIFIPITLLIATIKVLTTANAHNEIMALATSGVSLKKIIYSFLWVSSLLALFLYANYEYIHPSILRYTHTFEETFFKNHLSTDHKKVHSLLLQDESLLLYQTYDQEKQMFWDVFWICQTGEIYKMSFLDPHREIPFGFSVVCLQRKESGEITPTSSHTELAFPTLLFPSKDLFSAVHPPAMQSLSQLVSHVGWKQFHWGLGKMSDREAEVSAILFTKCTMPLLCFLVVLFPAPYCLFFSRDHSFFLLYILNLCGIIAFFTFIRAAAILGESQVAPPFWLLFLPQILLFLLCGRRYAKL